MKKNLLYGFKIVFPLVVICLATVIMLSSVNYFTAPIIEKNKEKNLEAAFGTLFGVAKEDRLVATPLSTAGTALDPATVKAVYEIRINDAPAGICVDVLGEGAYKGTIEALVAIDTEGRIVDISCIAQSETPGKGDAVLNGAFYKAHYAGKTKEQFGAQGPAVVAGSTKTSTALENAVNHALDAYELLYEKGAGNED